MFCNYECHQVGGPWVAENPACPIHGVNGDTRARHQEWLNEGMQEILCKVWNRELSADEGLYAIQMLID